MPKTYFLHLLSLVVFFNLLILIRFTKLFQIVLVNILVFFLFFFLFLFGTYA